MLFRSKNIEWYKEEIGKCTNREFTTGFYFGKPQADSQIYENSTYITNYVYLGTVGEIREGGLFRLEQKNKFSVGETIEIMKPSGENIETVVEAIFDEEGNPQESAPHARQIIDVRSSVLPQPFDILRRKEG